MQHKTGLFIGRFQPLHFGHISAIKQGLTQCEKIILCIGSADKNFYIDNPLTLEERQELVNEFIKQEDIQGKIKTITYINDESNNLLWLDNLVKKIPQFDLVIGNNNLVSLLTEYRGYQQFKPELTMRQLHQGKIIRHAILEDRSWKDLVPKYTHKILDKLKFEKRLKTLSSSGD